MSDLIDRQAAISAICNACGKIDCDKMDKCEKLQLPPANCSEFPNSSDTISRQAAIEALDEIEAEVADGYGYQYAKWREYFAKMQSAPLAPDNSGDLWITVPDIDKVTRIYAQESKSKFCRIFYEEQPELKTGKWILDRSGSYCCSKCMEPCAGYVMMKPRDKFCKMCGSRNEVTT